MSTKIILDAQSKRDIAKTFGITVGNVGLALLFKRNSKQSEMIRQMALEKGGKLVEEVEVKTPERKIKILDAHGNVKASKVI